MTLDEAIIQAEMFAEEYQSIADDLALDIFYCDNEVIKEHSANYQRRAEEQRQFAEWLKDYKRLLEQEPVLDKIRDEIKEKFEGCDICEWFDDYDYEENDISEYQYVGDVSDILKIINKYTAESEP